MKYELYLSKRAEKFLNKQACHQKRRIEQKLINFAKYYPNTYGYDWMKMKNEKNIYRIRIGKIRVVIDVNNRTRQLQVVKIDFRGSIYKN